MRLWPQNPYDLIRLLARRRSDPRKAIAELVQNSLDAGASRIESQWFTDRGKRALSIWDDGNGVFPGLPRDEALRKIAQTIGHSHERDLTPAQRREELILGQYGIGLIGFWSVGALLEMKSRVDGGRWEFNDAHPDFLLVAEDGEAQRVRYLVHLFAKEVVLRNFGGPGDAEVLERMVEVLTRLRRPQAGRRPNPH